MSHHNPLNDICNEHILSAFELLGEFNYTEANNRAIMLKNDAISQTASLYSTYLLRIVNMETLYTSQQFNKPGFFRKNLLDLYKKLIHDLNKDESVLSLGKNENIFKIFSDYAKIRLDLINIYGELSKANCSTYSIILEHIKIMEWDNNLSNYFPSLSIGIIKEVSIIKNLLLAQLALIAYNFKNSVLYTYLAKNDLNQWTKSLQAQIDNKFIIQEQASQSVMEEADDKIEFNIPNNQKWLRKFLSYTLAKINVYFNIILTKKSSEIMNTIKIQTDPDPLNMIKTFILNNTNIYNISLIYTPLSNKNSLCRSDGGYSCVSTVPLTGIHSYPAIFSFPNDPPFHHWPNIISIIQSKQQKSSCDLYNNNNNHNTPNPKYYRNNNNSNNNHSTSINSGKANHSNLEYCSSVDSMTSSFSVFSGTSTATTNAGGNGAPGGVNSMMLTSNMGGGGGGATSNASSIIYGTNNANLTSNNSTNINHNEAYSSKPIISDRSSITSLSSAAASLLMGSRRYSDRNKRMAKLNPNAKDNIVDKDANQSLDEHNTIPFFFYDRKIAVSYYMIKVDPEVVIVLIYECQNKDPTIVEFLTKLVCCLRNVTLFEQLKVDW